MPGRPLCMSIPGNLTDPLSLGIINSRPAQPLLKELTSTAGCSFRACSINHSFGMAHGKIYNNDVQFIGRI